MFNVHVFLQALLFLPLVALVIASGVTFWFHRWMTLKVIALGVCILSLSAAVGVICA